MRITLTVAASALALAVVYPNIAESATTCTFTDVDTTRFLESDCMTDETLFVPNGFTLDGQGFAITGADPDPSNGIGFKGPVITNAGTIAHVTNLVVHGNFTVNQCDGGADRLRGIMFDGASGSITRTTVQNINQGASGCQEGNAVEIRNGPFDGTHPNTQFVDILHNVFEEWQKTGIVCNGDVDCNIQHNVVGASATQEYLAPNSVQIGFGALGHVEHNHIAGNEWIQATGAVGTAVLTFDADDTTIQRNNISGNAQVGIFVITGWTIADSGPTFVDNNRVFERDADAVADYFDVGLWSFGPNNTFTNNKVRGYDDPAVGDGITGTKVVPSPGDAGAACFLPDESAQSC